VILEIFRLKIKKIVNWDFFPILFFGLLVMSFHFFVRPSGDDITYGTVFYHQPVLAFIHDAYYTWSSRIVIMPVAAFFAGNSFWLFSVVNILVYGLLAVMISRIFVDKNRLKTNWALIFLLICVPFVSMMTTAGWVVTNIHYLWPLTFALVAIYPIKKICVGEIINWYEYPLYFLAAIFGMNMELVAAILVSVYLIFCLYFGYRKKNSIFVILMAAILVGNLFFILLCPGNGAREVSEIVANFPEYATFGFVQKLTVSATSHMFTIDQNFIMLTVMAMAGLFSWQKYKAWLPRIIGIIPFVICLMINWARILVLSPKFGFLFSVITGKSIHDWVTLSGIIGGQLNFYHYLGLVFMFTFVLSLIAMTVILFKDEKTFGVAILAIGASIMSRVVMGFSPTVYASGARTFLFQYIAMVIFGVLMYREFNPLMTSNKQNMLFKLLGFMGVLGYLESLLKLI